MATVVPVDDLIKDISVKLFVFYVTSLKHIIMSLFKVVGQSSTPLNCHDSYM